MYPILAAKGIPFGVSPYFSLGYCVNALQAGGLCVFRPGAPDCPLRAGEGDPRQAAQNFMQYSAGVSEVLRGADRAWLEITNECQSDGFSRALLEWWRDFYDEAITIELARGGPPLALPGLPPGTGDILMFSVWKPMLERLKNTGGIFSMHDYTFHSQTGLCAYDEWEAARHTTNHRLMGLLGYEIPITITEAARGSGNDPVDVNDFICWIEKVRVEGYVHSVWLWLGGYHAYWPLANLDTHYTEIALHLSVYP